MAGGKYPIYSQEDADNAWDLRNNGKADPASVVTHIRKRVKALGLKMPGGDGEDLDETGRQGDDSYEFAPGVGKAAKRKTPEELDEADLDDVLALATGKPKRKGRSSASIGGSRSGLGVTESGGYPRGWLLHRMGYDNVASRDADGRLSEAMLLQTDEPMARRRGGLLEAMLPADIVDEIQDRRLREERGARIREALAGL